MFNEEFAALGQVTLSLLDDRLQVAGTYVRGEFGDFVADAGDDISGIFDLGVGTSAANNPFDNEAIDTNNFGVEAAYQLNDRISLNAFGLYTEAQEANGDGEVDIWSYGAGLSLPDFGKEGNLAAIFAGVEPYEGTQDLPIHLEALYKYQLNDNVSITPGVEYLISPNGDDDEEDALIGVLRTTFTF